MIFKDEKVPVAWKMNGFPSILSGLLFKQGHFQCIGTYESSTDNQLHFTRSVPTVSKC